MNMHPQDLFTLLVSLASCAGMGWVTHASIDHGYVIFSGVSAVAFVLMIAWTTHVALTIMDDEANA